MDIKNLIRPVNMGQALLCMASLGMFVGCDATDMTSIEHQTSSMTTGYTQSSQAFVSSRRKATSSSVNYTSSSAFSEGEGINHLIFPTGEYSIDNQGLALLYADNFLAYGAIHGKTIKSNSDWEYEGDTRLLALTPTVDKALVLATFESAVVVLDRSTGAKLAEVATPNGPATDVLLINNQLLISMGESPSTVVNVYLMTNQGQPTLNSTATFEGSINMEFDRNSLWLAEQIDSDLKLNQCSLTAGELDCTLYKDVPHVDASNFVISPDGRWIVTTTNDVISIVDASLPTTFLNWHVGRKGFVDMGFREDGSLVAIDLAGRVVLYGDVMSSSEPEVALSDVSLNLQSMFVSPECILGTQLSNRNVGEFEFVTIFGCVVSVPEEPSASAGFSSSSAPALSVLSAPTVSMSSSSPSSETSTNATYTYYYANAPSTAWVESTGWAIEENQEVYQWPLSNVYVFLNAEDTSNPNPDSLYTTLRLHVNANNRESRYRISFDVKAASVTPNLLKARLVDGVQIADDSPMLASSYAVTYPLVTQNLTSNEWVTVSGEFDFWGSSALTLHIYSSNSETFQVNNLKLEDVGASTVGSGMIRLQ